MQTQNQTSFQESESKGTQISLFKNCKATNSTPISIDKLFELIRSGQGFKEIIVNLRATDDQNEKDRLKSLLPAVTLSGLFDKGRKKENLTTYSGLMQIDLDKIDNITEVRASLEKDKYSFAVFLSPSGNGLKLIVRVSDKVNNHYNSFLALEKYYKTKYNLQIDKNCKDFTRLMFLSWDESLFINEQAIVFLKENESNEIDFKNEFDKAVIYINKKESFNNGNRNNFVFKLASLCCRKGISYNFTLSEIIKKYASIDFLQKEIENTVISAYHQPSNDSAKKIEKDSSYSKISQVEKFLNSKYKFRNNIVSGKIEYRRIDLDEDFSELNENNVYIDLCRNNLEISITKLLSYLHSDNVPAFNPFLNYFENLGKWDSKNEIDFIDKLCEYIPVKERNRFNKQFRKMLVRCVACALEDDVFNKHAFILVHNIQHTGKSTFCRWLCPKALYDYITETIGVDKDGQITLATNFFINLDELSTMTKSDVNALKSFISKDKINVRLPYDRRATVRPRRANFIGSTNKDEFLTDETGSVRWLCFELVDNINFAYKDDIDINDIWRQAYSLYLAGFNYLLTKEEIEENERTNKSFIESNPELELISKYFIPGIKEENSKFFTATDIQIYLAKEAPNIHLTPKLIGRALKFLGFTKTTIYVEDKGYSIKGYFVKVLKIDNSNNSNYSFDGNPS